jgi:antitoxin (DNA-binding transcriptional repressor) of toxin-antitoxin stability system
LKSLIAFLVFLTGVLCPLVVRADQEQLVERQVLVMLHLPKPHYRPDAGYGGAYLDGTGHGARKRIAEQLAREHGLRLLSDWPMPVLGVDCYVMEVPVATSPQRIAELLSHDSRVEWAQPMGMFHGMGDDPLYPAQPSASQWHVAELHRVATGRNVRIAVVDSGVDERHPDLEGQVAVVENFVDGSPYTVETHGTAVAGIIAAKAGNGIGIAGVAPGARLMALRACWQQGTSAQAAVCSSFTLGKALNFAISHGAQVINLSLAGPPDRLLQRLIDAAIRNGITVVGAADTREANGGFPASYPGVLAIVEQESRDTAPGFFRAPGRDIPTTVPGARWSMVNGSSYATAHVSGLVALMRELQPAPKLLPVGIDASAGAARPFATRDRIGTIDACATLARVAGRCVCSCTIANMTKADDYR